VGGRGGGGGVWGGGGGGEMSGGTGLGGVGVGCGGWVGGGGWGVWGLGWCFVGFGCVFVWLGRIFFFLIIVFYTGRRGLNVFIQPQGQPPHACDLLLEKHRNSWEPGRKQGCGIIVILGKNPTTRAGEPGTACAVDGNCSWRKLQSPRICHKASTGLGYPLGLVSIKKKKSSLEHLCRTMGAVDSPCTSYLKNKTLMFSHFLNPLGLSATIAPNPPGKLCHCKNPQAS